MYCERASGIHGVVVWHAEPSGTSGTHVLPDGCTDLIWHEDGLLVAGPDMCAQFSDLGARRRLAAVRFAPGVGARFFGVDASELLDARIPLEDVWSTRRARDLLVRAERDPCGALVETARQVLDARDPDPLADLADALTAGMPVSEAAETLGWSERTLHRRAKRAYGYGPKSLARILRFRRAVARARAGDDFAYIAADCGYSDQSHLAREVRALSGSTLSSLIGDQMSMPIGGQVSMLIGDQVSEGPGSGRAANRSIG